MASSRGVRRRRICCSTGCGATARTSPPSGATCSRTARCRRSSSSSTCAGQELKFIAMGEREERERRLAQQAAEREGRAGGGAGGMGSLGGSSTSLAGRDGTSPKKKRKPGDHDDEERRGPGRPRSSSSADGLFKRSRLGADGQSRDRNLRPARLCQRVGARRGHRGSAAAARQARRPASVGGAATASRARARWGGQRRPAGQGRGGALQGGA